ncbi:MAG: HDIG domain-containing metalloprotein [Akkermansia sp.]
MNRPLMKRLQMEAPGTFHHCLMASPSWRRQRRKPLGPIPIECRVEAYYHDIGKMQNPLYFIENNMDGPNPHDGADAQHERPYHHRPRSGRGGIVENNLPRPLVDVIEQHHGTSLAYFFYRKALQYRDEILSRVESGLASPDDVPEVVESNFRYKGPNPQSKETGIVSLADIVESATRSMGKIPVRKCRKGG